VRWWAHALCPALQVSLLDSKRAFAVNIAIQTLRPSSERVLELLAQDGENQAALTSDAVRALSSILPGPEELQALVSFTGVIAELTPPERFMIRLVSVRGLPR
jgi:hypothetical protein